MVTIVYLLRAALIMALAGAFVFLCIVAVRSILQRLLSPRLIRMHEAIKPLFDPSFGPTQLGLLERFHQTLKVEEVYWRLYDSPFHARQCLEEFRRRYNTSRPHWALIRPEGGDPRKAQKLQILERGWNLWIMRRLWLGQPVNVQTEASSVSRG